MDFNVTFCVLLDAFSLTLYEARTESHSMANSLFLRENVRTKLFAEQQCRPRRAWHVESFSFVYESALAASLVFDSAMRGTQRCCDFAATMSNDADEVLQAALK